ncbi:MAG: Fic family protein [Candidatus Hydrogenedentes bacterium]|nr:Fic family protein [Candidatus Hydrogenedentota bacterium]
MRTYTQTHPWLKFALDLRQIEYTTWLLLGEAVSKVEHIAGVPLKPDAAQHLHAVYLAKGVLATTAIEGNTLTEEEVLEHLQGRLKLPPSRQYLSQEIDNIVDACNRIGADVLQKGATPISVDEILEYNKLILRKLPLAEDVAPGILRTHSVMVGRYRGAPAEDCRHLLGEFCRWLNDLKFEPGLEQVYAILAAIAAHLYFVWIHPFGDGNGRTARLIEFRYLLQAGFPTPAAHLLSNFYNQTRTEYYRQLDRASRSGGQMAEFIAYAVQGLVDQLREQLRFIRDLQWDTAWRNYVYEKFGKSSSSQLRMRHLVLELSKVEANGGWVSIPAVPDLSARMAKEYAGKTSKTLNRDINAVTEMGLVQREGRQIRANKESILAFLPARALAKHAPTDEDPA